MADTPSTDGAPTDCWEYERDAIATVIEEHIEGENLSYRAAAEAVLALLPDIHPAVAPSAELESVRTERDALSDECLRLTEAMGRYAEEQMAVEAERDRLAATIARVEAVVAAVEAVRPGYDWMVPASSLRAALDGPPGDRNFSELTGHPFQPAAAHSVDVEKFVRADEGTTDGE